MTPVDISKLIAQSKLKAKGYLDRYDQDLTIRFNTFIDNAQQESGMNYLKDQLVEANKKFSFVLKNFPRSLVSEEVFSDQVFNDDDFDQWYKAFKFIEADKSFSPVFTFNPEFELDVFEQERSEYTENPTWATTDSILFFSEVVIIVISYFLFRKNQIQYLETKIRNTNAGRPGPGLNCPFTPEQKAKLYEGCKDQNLIAPDTDKDNFIKALSHDEYPIEKIRWIDVNREGRLKSISLACFYYTVVPSSQDAEGNYTIDRPAIKRCFTDSDGNDAIVTTPKKTDSNFDFWKRKFRTMLAD